MSIFESLDGCMQMEWRSYIFDTFRNIYDIWCNKSLVQIKDVTFNNIRGTSNSLVTVNFNCSYSFPCQKINLNDIKLITENNAKPTIASCANAIGHTTDIELPPSFLKPTRES
ncbi:hypothetical protein RDI58_000499 [Solanum bulbocastanum]|uniref:Exopolygalacturonase n=1 Tax=Solanum bulbocastanum TaxID=147425 RepID=A0AAN8UC61_SOLBU